MLSSVMAACLAPFAQMANRHAMSAVYKSLEIGPDYVRACSQYGMMDAALKLGVEQPIWIDALTLVSVLKSLPAEEINFTVKGNSLEWECGLSTGKLALLGEQKIPRIESSVIPQSEAWAPPDSFIDALDLGSIACGSIGMASAGVYGVLFDNRNDFSILSSDNITVASCKVSAIVPAFPDLITFSPDAVAMLETVLDGKTEGVAIAIDSKALYCVNKAFRLLLRPIPPIKHDLRQIISNFGEGNSVAAIPEERLGAFVKRALALAETKGQSYVSLAAASGALSMSFAEGASASDEYYIVDGLVVPTLPEIKLDAGRVARVLGYASELILDHIERRVLVFRGKTPPFLYMVSGTQG